jgi:hypothetical protein
MAEFSQRYMFSLCRICRKFDLTLAPSLKERGEPVHGYGVADLAGFSMRHSISRCRFCRNLKSLSGGGQRRLGDQAAFSLTAAR